MTEIHASYDVLVLGDSDTVGRPEVLAERAAERGAVIAHSFAFDPGEAAAHENLTDIEAVVIALSRAIASHTDIWVPFPLQDLCREQHFRRLSLALQRHGLNLLMGPELEPCPIEGGYSAVDAALREEVRCVDELDIAALAAAGVRTLGVEIETFLSAAASASPREPDDDPECEGIGHESYFSTAEVAAYLGKSADWVSRGLRQKAFAYPDGSLVHPIQAGRGGRRKFTVAMMRAIAWSSYRRGVLNKQELETVLERIHYAW
ncbi:MAG: hypothetical protein ACR2JM_13535 [Mycobacterium sp.]